MSKPGGWNEEMLLGGQVAGSLISGVATVNSTTAVALSSTSVDIQWVIIQNISTVNIFVGPSSVANSGANRSVQLRRNAVMRLNIHNLNEVFLIAASSSGLEVLFLAGFPGGS